MSMSRTVRCIVSAVVVALASGAAFAGRYWVCNSADATFSNTNNWLASQEGVGGATKPGDGATGTTYFYKYKNGSIVFDELPTLPGDVRIGTKSDDYFVWSATDSSCGLFGTNRSVQVGDKISGVCTPTYLKVDSGTYSFNYARIGYESGGTAELLLNGGDFSCYKGDVGATGYANGTLTVKGGTFTTTSTSTSDSMTIGSVTNSTGTVVVDGGTLVNVGYVNLSSVSNVNGLINVKSGNWIASGIRIGGKTSKTASYVDHAVGRIVVDGGNVAWTNANAMTFGHAIGEGSYAELVVNGGDVACNATYLYLGETGPATFTMNGGTFRMTNTSGGGFLTIGHAQTGYDVGTIVLNGGELAVRQLRLDYAQPGSKVVFNGGTLKPILSTSDFINANANFTCELQEGGLVVDTAGYNVTIKHPLVLANGVTSAPLIKKGAGTLTISGTTPFSPENVFVYEGKAVVGGTTYAANVGDAIDASAGGDLGVVVTHGDTLEAWLKDPDYTTPYSTKYRAAGTNSLEQPLPVIVSVNGALKKHTNLEIGRTYGDTLNGVSYSFTTENLAPRTLQVVSANGTSTMNVRDVGSWPLLSVDGTAKMNQGVIFRGANLDHFANSTAAQKAASALANLKTEIDLRTIGVDGINSAYQGATKSWAAVDADYVYCPIDFSNGGTQVDSDANGNFTNQVRRMFSRLGTPGALPAYFHCAIGTDRTGITGLLLLGLMGVSEESLYRDYLMSNFASIGGSRNAGVPEKFILHMLRGRCNGNKYVYCNNPYGESVAARARAYLEMCGVTTEEIGNITQALSGETPDQVLARVNAYEAANNVRTVSYMTVRGSSSTNSTHRLPAGQHFFPMTAPTRNGYVFTGWDTENETNGYVYATWEELYPLYWASTNGVTESFTRAASWDPAPDGTFAPTDTLVLNKGNDKIALFSEGSAKAKALYVGWGTYDGGRNFSTSRCLGGRLDVTGGLLAITNYLYVGGYSSTYSNIVNVTGGCLVAGILRMGDYNDSKSNGKCDVINISGSGVVSNTTGEAQLSLRSGASSRINVSDGGTFASRQNVRVGSYSKATIALEGNSTMDMPDKDLYVGHYAKALGEVSLSDSQLSVKDVFVGYSASATGIVSVAGNSTLTSSHYIYLGRLGDAELTIDGGLVSVADRVQFGYSGASGNLAVLNLNGGKLKVRRISVAAAPSAVVNWNGGTLECASGGDGNMIPANANLVVRVLEGGAVYNAVIRDNEEIKEDLSGVGALTKRGSRPLKVSGAVDLEGGFVVEEGKLTLMNLTRTEFARISVAEGASLDLNGAEVTVDKYMLGEARQAAGTYTAHNGTIHVNAQEPQPQPAAVATDTPGYDYTNRVVTVTNATADAQLTLTATAPDGTTVTVSATTDSNGEAVFDIPTAPGSAYSYTVSSDGETIAAGGFFTGGWDESGSWFSASAESGASVVSGGDWKTVPTISDGKYLVNGEADFALGAESSAAGSSRFVRVDFTYSFDAFCVPGSLADDSVPALGGFSTIVGATGNGSWAAYGSGGWTALYGDVAPVVGQTYSVRAETDFTSNPPRIRYEVSADAGTTFTPLFTDEGRTARWVVGTKSASTFSSVMFGGRGAVASLRGEIANANVAEADGVGYSSLADAVAAATNSLVLLTNATWPTNSPVGTTPVDLGGHALGGVTIDGDGNVVVQGGYAAVPGGKVNISLAQVAALGVVTEGKSPAQIASALNENGANGIPLWMSYVLGLDPTKADAKPAASIVLNGGNVELALVGIDVNESAGATVTYKVYKAADLADLENAQPMEGEHAFDESASLPKSDPKLFYRLKLDVKGY